MIVSTISVAQGYQDYIGAGHNDNIIITSSSSFANATADKTLDGSGLLRDRYMAARFLGQATLGFDESDVDDLMTQGFEAWIDDQIQVSQSEISPIMNSIWSRPAGITCLKPRTNNCHIPG